jgi:hypothetical protein
VGVAIRITPAATIALMVVVLAAGPGCGRRVRHVESLDGVDAGKRVRIEGTLSLRGSTPVTTPVLETEQGETIPLDAKEPGLLSQLRGLSDMRVAIEGNVLPMVDQNLPRLSATRYEMLPLPNGDVPIVGIVSKEFDQSILTTDTGERYWLHLEALDVLERLTGARVWVTGTKFDTDAKTRPKKSTPLTVTGHGVVEANPAH